MKASLWQWFLSTTKVWERKQVWDEACSLGTIPNQENLGYVSLSSNTWKNMILFIYVGVASGPISLYAHKTSLTARLTTILIERVKYHEQWLLDPLTMLPNHIPLNTWKSFCRCSLISTASWGTPLRNVVAHCPCYPIFGLPQAWVDKCASNHFHLPLMLKFSHLCVWEQSHSNQCLLAKEWMLYYLWSWWGIISRPVLSSHQIVGKWWVVICATHAWIADQTFLKACKTPRRHFVTTVVQHLSELQRGFIGKDGMEGALKTISARAIGNRPHMWEITYDQLIKTNEANVIRELMGSLRVILQNKVKESKVLAKRRSGMMKDQLNNHLGKKRNHDNYEDQSTMPKKAYKANSVWNMLSEP